MSNPDKETIQERAQGLLQVHGGRCFVETRSPLLKAFREMESMRLVIITDGCGVIEGFNIQAIGFTPLIETDHELDEEQAH